MGTEIVDTHSTEVKKVNGSAPFDSEQTEDPVQQRKSLQPPQGKRRKGLRKKLIGGVVAAGVVLGGLFAINVGPGSNNKSESTSSANPTPTTEVVPTIAPSSTESSVPQIVTADTIIKGEHPSVTNADITTDFENIYDNVPGADALFPKTTVMPTVTLCIVGNPQKDAATNIMLRQIGCKSLVQYAYEIFKKTGSSIALKGTIDSYSYAKTLGAGNSSYMDTIITSLNLIDNPTLPNPTS
jgi:hypothetical protein